MHIDTATLENVNACRHKLGAEAVAKLCFEKSNIYAMLIDDGLRVPFPLVANGNMGVYIYCLFF